MCIRNYTSIYDSYCNKSDVGVVYKGGQDGCASVLEYILQVLLTHFRYANYVISMLIFMVLLTTE